MQLPFNARADVMHTVERMVIKSRQHYDDAAKRKVIVQMLMEDRAE